MADVDKQNDDQQEQYITNEDNDNISSLIEQIYKQLVCIILVYSRKYSSNKNLSLIRFT